MNELAAALGMSIGRKIGRRQVERANKNSLWQFSGDQQQKIRKLAKSYEDTVYSTADAGKQGVPNIPPHLLADQLERRLQKGEFESREEE